MATKRSKKKKKINIKKILVNLNMDIWKFFQIQMKIFSFLNDSLGENKQHNDTLDYFNYGLDGEKYWITLYQFNIRDI